MFDLRTSAWMVSLLLFVGVGCEKSKQTSDDDKEKKEKKVKKKKKKPEVEPNPDKPATVGLVTVESDKSVKDVMSALDKRLSDAGGVSIIARVDHAKNAKSADMELPPTRLLMFSNPQLDMPFVQEVLPIGLDFPQKILVWETSDGTTRVAFNAPSYAAKRHGVEKFGLQLGRQEEGLANTVSKATGVDVPEMPKRDAIGIDKGQGVVRKESNNGVSDTFEKLKGLVEEADGLKAMATVDYKKAAKEVDKELTPAKLLVFGNPKLGTPLMKKAPTVALDLPQKMYVYGTKKGAIYVAFNDPEYLAMRHGIDSGAKPLEKMSKKLEDLAEEACEEIEN